MQPWHGHLPRVGLPRRCASRTAPVFEKEGALDKDATFAFELPPGAFVFRLQRGGITYAAENPPLHVVEGEDAGDLRLVFPAPQPPGAIAGIVVDAATGARIEEFEVEAHVDSETEISPRHGEMKQGPAPGDFSVAGLSPGLAALRVVAPGYARGEEKVRVAPGEQHRLTVRLQPEGVLAVRVEENGAATEDAYVHAVARETGRRYGAEWDKAAGAHLVKTLPAGQYRVTARTYRSEDVSSFTPSRTWQAAAADVRVAAGERRELTLRLATGDCVLRGSVFSGGIGAHHEIFVTAPDADPEAFWDPKTEVLDTVRAGAGLPVMQNGLRTPFAITGLEAGAYQVVVRVLALNEEVLRLTSEDVQLAPGEARELDFELR